MTLYCPKCKGIVYSRRHKFCGFCGAQLPAEFLFTESELAVLAREEAEIENRRKVRKTKDDAEEQERRKGDSFSAE
jgi:hypothetical protein